MDVSAQMNTTPLIDVLLVMLVLLILTVPIATHTVHLSLPAQRGPVAAQAPIDIEIDFDGRVWWAGFEIQEGALEERMRAAARDDRAVRVWPDRRVRFQPVATVLAAGQRAHVEGLALAPLAD